MGVAKATLFAFKKVFTTEDLIPKFVSSGITPNISIALLISNL